ncbi:hypothetical protein BBP40_001686 [Aspergillus hancockii]|nr:hypothetical protein BBP40_001686 [Aspergillus hancockii]
MNSLLKRLTSLFWKKEPRDSPISEPESEPEENSISEQRSTKHHSPVPSSDMSPKPVSVVVSPPAFDLDSYEFLNEEFLRRTVDEILSDQADFNNSFDEYTGERMMDGCFEDTGAVGFDSEAESARSLYFSKLKATEKPVGGARRLISKIGSTDDEGEEEVLGDQKFEEGGGFPIGLDGNVLSVGEINGSEDGADEQARIDEVKAIKEEELDGLRASAVAIVDDYVHGDEDDVEVIKEEDVVFSSVSEEEHGRLVGFLAEHPFMKDGEYPVKRSERHNFISDVRREATVSGMDEAALIGLVRWVKKVYLEVRGIDRINREGSEFGDEIDDENVVEVMSSRDWKKERKRKRSSAERPKEKDRRSKRRSLMSMDSHDSIMSDKHDGRMFIDLDSDSAIVISESHTPDIQVMEEAPVSQTESQQAQITHLVKQDDPQVGRVDNDEATVRALATPSNMRFTKMSLNGKSSPSMSKAPHDDPVLDTAVHSNGKKTGASQMPSSQHNSPRKFPFVTAEPVNPQFRVSEEMKPPPKDALSRKTLKHRRKRQRQRERRRSGMSTATSEIGEPSEKGKEQDSQVPSSISHEKPTENTVVVRKDVAMDDPFWDLDF